MKDVTIIGCEVLRDEIATVARECRIHLVSGHLHFHHDRLREELTERIDAAPKGGTVLLGYGRCALGGGMLAAGDHRLVVPAVDNCVALLLGSGTAYRRQLHDRPGSLFYTRGWTEGMDDPYRMYVQAVERMGEEAARRWADLLFATYSRVTLVEADSLPTEQARDYVRRVAAAGHLPVETIDGSLQLLRRLVDGPHDEDFIVIEPGGVLDDSSFWRRERPLGTRTLLTAASRTFDTPDDGSHHADLTTVSSS